MGKSHIVLDAYKGLGTSFWIELFLEDNEILKVPLPFVTKRLEDTITEFEKKYSRFRDDSLLSILNKNKSIPYDEDLAKMLIEAQKVSLATGNVFSIFIKEDLEGKGYGKKIVQLPPEASNHPEEASSFLIEGDTIYLKGNKGIDLGGIGKGYLIDKLVLLLKNEFALDYFLINGGGDIYVTSDNGQEVELFLEHPHNTGEYLNKICIKNSSLCSSSSFKRTWKHEGKQVNHFIADDEVWAASYVVGDNATITDMYATVFCILADKKEILESLATASHVEYIVLPSTNKMLISKGFPALMEE